MNKIFSKLELIILLVDYIDFHLDADKRSMLEQMMLEDCSIRELAVRIRSSVNVKSKKRLFNNLLFRFGAEVKDCLSGVNIEEYCNLTLASDIIKQIENHIEKCDYCLWRVVQNIRSKKNITSTEKMLHSIESNHVVKIDENVVKPILDDNCLGQVSVCMAGLRLKRFNFEHKDFSTMLSVSENLSHTAVSASIKAGCKLKENVIQKQVMVNDLNSGKPLLSSKTDNDGCLVIPRLLPGEYSILFVEQNLQIELNISA